MFLFCFVFVSCAPGLSACGEMDGHRFVKVSRLCVGKVKSNL